MTARIARLPPLAAALAGVALAGSALGAPPWVVGAADEANPLDRTIVDVAILPSTFGATGIERDRLLTLQLGADGIRGSSRLAILERAEGRWSEIASVVVAGAGRRWLVDAGAGIFAIISEAEPGGGGPGVVTTVSVGSDSIALRHVVTLDFSVTGGAAADVDGDGSPELVLAGRSDRRRLGVCLGTRILGLDATTLRTTSSVELRELEFDRAVLGEFDGRPGADLAGRTRCDELGTSPTDPRPAQPRIIAVRLGDGAMTLRLPVATGDADVIRAADLDGDAIDELVISSGAGPLAVLSGPRGPDGGPATKALADAPSRLPLFTFPWSEARPSSVIVAGDSDVRVFSDAREVARSTELSGPRWTTVVADRSRTVAQGDPPVGLWADLDADGCLDLLMPMFIVACRDPLSADAPAQGSDPVIRRGPLWTASRPIAMVGRGSASGLLVAQSIAPSDLAGLRAPTPSVAWAAENAGGWRTGSSGPFVLSELSLPDLLYFPVYPVPAPTMEGRALGRPPVVQASGWSGTNYLVRVLALEEGDPEPTRTPELAVFLAGFAGEPPDPRLGPAASVSRIAVSPGHPAGADTAVATVLLDDARTASGAQARRWAVTFVAFNAWGEMSDPVMRVVTRDLTGPPMTVAAPFTSVPWPLSARITGVTEPGATVQVNGGEELSTTSRGAFETRVTLAPWPQDVRIRAVDETGNVTVRVISMMGGLDVRQLPWQVIVALLVLVAVLVGTIREGRRVQVRLVAADRLPARIGDGSRGSRAQGRQGYPSGRARRRDGGWLADERDDLPLPEIEEIPPSVG